MCVALYFMANLNQEYKNFINAGNSIEPVIQEILDRMQYIPGFLAKQQELIKEHESPFEEKSTSQGNLRVLKPQYK